ELAVDDVPEALPSDAAFADVPLEPVEEPSVLEAFESPQAAEVAEPQELAAEPVALAEGSEIDFAEFTAALEGSVPAEESDFAGLDLPPLSDEADAPQPASEAQE